MTPSQQPSPPLSMDEASKISSEIRSENGKAEQLLAAKCRWEHMSRTAVIREWGDPRNWK